MTKYLLIAVLSSCGVDTGIPAVESLPLPPDRPVIRPMEVFTDGVKVSVKDWDRIHTFFLRADSWFDMAEHALDVCYSSE